MSLRALTLWRPWAAAIAHGTKRVENRTWVPPRSMFGQDIAIHAGQRIDADAVDEVVLYLPRSLLPGPTGIVAVVRLAGFIEERGAQFFFGGISIDDAKDAARSPWFDGDTGWVLDRVRPLAEPVPCRGAQGLWVVPADVEVRVAEQLQRLAEEGGLA